MKPLLTITKQLPVLLSIILLITSCTFTTTLSKPPAFKESADSVGAKINSLVTCERMNFDGSIKKSNGKTSAEIEIDIINGKDIPSDLF